MYTCKLSAAMMPTLSSLVAPEVVIMTTSGTTSDDKDGIIPTLAFNVEDVPRILSETFSLNIYKDLYTICVTTKD